MAVKTASLSNDDANLNWVKQLDLDLQGNAYRQIVLHLLHHNEFERALQLIVSIEGREFLPYSTDFVEELMSLTIEAIAQSSIAEGEALISKYLLLFEHYSGMEFVVEQVLICAKYFREHQLLQQEKSLLIATERKITQSNKHELYLEIAFYYFKIGNEKDAKRLYRKSVNSFSKWQHYRLLVATKSLQMEATLKKRWKDADCSKPIEEVAAMLSENDKAYFLATAAKHFMEEQKYDEVEPIFSAIKRYYLIACSYVMHYYKNGGVAKVESLLSLLDRHDHKSLLEMFIKQATTREHWQMILLIDDEVLKDKMVWYKQFNLLSPNDYEIVLNVLPTLPHYLQKIIVEALMFHIFKAPHLMERFLVHIPLAPVKTLQFMRIMEQLKLEPALQSQQAPDLSLLFDALNKVSTGEWSLAKFKQYVQEF